MKSGKYDSRLEETVGYQLGSQWNYHCSRANRIAYVIHKNYEPDFWILRDKKLWVVEVKGYFRPGDALKYLNVRDGLSKWGVYTELEKQGEAAKIELIFVFADPNKQILHLKKRKNGKRTTHGEWARDHGFEFFKHDALPRYFTTSKTADAGTASPNV